ncbi:MAG: Ldh family oxidoreductase [Streptosporangiales bacterium]
MPSNRIAAADLADLAASVLAAHGVPRTDAVLVADSLVQADLWDHQSHGLLRLRWYTDRIRSGVMDPVTRAETVVDAGAVAVVDGHDGVGQVLAAHAAGEATRRAAEHGIGAVAVRNSGHFGTAAYFTRMAPPKGCIGLLTTNASPAMAPWGGRAKAVGSNPWSIAAPVGDRVMVMDISNAAVARGKIYLARNRGEPIPPGWAMSADGRPTTEPDEAIAGLTLPMAEHKGYAISLMMDVLSGVLTGSGFGSAVTGPYQSESRSRCGHLYLALRIDAFLPGDEFRERMNALVGELKSVPPAPGFDAVLYPGEVEDRAECQNRREGLLLPDETVADLSRLATESGVEAAALPRPK